jgi:hypothetical protein
MDKIMPKTLAVADLETGLAFEEQMAAAVEALKGANAAYQMYIAILRKKYDAPADAWTLKDWAEGFIETEGASDG